MQSTPKPEPIDANFKLETPSSATSKRSLRRFSRRILTGWPIKTAILAAIFAMSISQFRQHVYPSARCKILAEPDDCFFRLTPVGRYLLTENLSDRRSDGERRVSIWEAQSGTHLGRTRANRSLIGNDWEVSNDATLLATIQSNSEARIHELPSGNLLATCRTSPDLPSMSSCAFCPDGTLLLMHSAGLSSRWDWRRKTITRLIAEPVKYAKCYLPRTIKCDFMFAFVVLGDGKTDKIAMQLRKWRTGEIVREFATAKTRLEENRTILHADLPTSEWSHGDFQSAANDLVVDFAPDGRWLSVSRKSASDPVEGGSASNRTSDNLGSSWFCDLSSDETFSSRFGNSTKQLYSNGRMLVEVEDGVEWFDLNSRQTIDRIRFDPQSPGPRNGMDLTWGSSTGDLSDLRWVLSEQSDDTDPDWGKLNGIRDLLEEHDLLPGTQTTTRVFDAKSREICKLTLPDVASTPAQFEFSPDMKTAVVKPSDESAIYIFDVPWPTNWKRVLPLALIPTAIVAFLYMVVFGFCRLYFGNRPAGVAEKC